MTISPATLRKASRRTVSHGIRSSGNRSRFEFPIGAERRNLTPGKAINTVQKEVGEIPVVVSSLSVAEIGHAIYRATTVEIRSRRRKFLDDLKSAVPIHPVSEVTAEIIARIGGQEAAKGINLPLADLIIGACALELGYAIGTSNLRDFERIPELNVIRL